MSTGIVFQIEGRKAVVLKADGEFVHVNAKSGWQVGETVIITTPARNRMRPLLTIAACLAVVILGGFGWNQLYASPVSLISLDVNPSIELGVNRWGRVVTASALNEEGTAILTQANTNNIGYQDALSSILSIEGESGFLTANANVVLTVFSQNETIQTSLLAESQNVVDSKISLYSNQITTEYYAVDETTVDGAHGHGVTAGKYLYLQKLQSLAPETDLSQYTHHSIEQIKSQIEVCKQEHAGEAENAPHGEAHVDETDCDS